MFLKDLWSMVQSYWAKGRTPNLDEYPELQSGDRFVGTITDPYLLALLTIYDDRKGRRLLLEWPSPPSSVTQAKAMLAESMEVDTIGDLAQNEIRKAFNLGPNDPVVLRQGRKTPVVVVPVPEGTPLPADGLTVAATDLVNAVNAVNEMKAAIRELALLASVLDGGCGDPDCPVHGLAARARGFRDFAFPG